MELKVKVKDPENITYEEYEKAQSICRRFQYQQDKTVNVTAIYEGIITQESKVPDDWSHEKIKEELKTGRCYYSQVDKDEEDEYEMTKLIELIVDGENVKL